MDLSFSVSPLWLLPGLLVALGVAWWAYRKTTPALPPILRGLLGLLRATVLLTLFVLLTGPVWHRTTTTEEAPILALLLDTSQSMGLQQADRRNLAEEHQRLFQKLLEMSWPGQVRTFTFSDRPVPFQEGDSIGFTGVRTDLSRALEDIQEHLKNEPLRAVVLVTDGIYTTGRNPLHVAERYPVPIFPIVAGDTSQQRDVRIQRVATNEIVYAGTEVPIRVTLFQQGYPARPLTLSLRVRNGHSITDTTVTLPASEQETTVDLRFRPEAPGIQTLELRIERLPGEITYANNRMTLTFQVLERKKQILLIAGAPDPTLAAMRQILEQDADLALTVRTQQAPGTFYEGPLPDSLEAFDVLLLVGYPGRGASEANLRRIEQAARAGLPVGLFMTFTTRMEKLPSLASVLPVQSERMRTTWTEAFVHPTPEGAAHAILQIPGITPALYQQLPPLQVNESTFRMKPDARLLLQRRIQQVVLPDPMLVIWQRERQRSLAFLGAGLWSWHNPPPDLEAVRTFWTHLLENSLRWLTAGDARQPVRVRPAARMFDEQEPVHLIGEVYDESLQPVSDATLRVEVEDREGHRFTYVMTAVGHGRYELTTGPLPAGTYAFRATATRHMHTLGTDEGTFAVGSLSLEFRQTRARADLLAQMALRSGGKAFYPDSLEALPDVLRSMPEFQPVTRTVSADLRLWESPYVLMLLLLLLTAEWFLRKRSGLI